MSIPERGSLLNLNIFNFEKDSGGIFEQWERKTGLKRGDANFGYAVRDELSNEDEKVANGILSKLGLIETNLTEKHKVDPSLIARPYIPLDPTIVPSWVNEND